MFGFSFQACLRSVPRPHGFCSRMQDRLYSRVRYPLEGKVSGASRIHYQRTGLLIHNNRLSLDRAKRKMELVAYYT